MPRTRLIALVIWLIEVGPTFLLWLLILAWPAWKNLARTDNGNDGQ